MRRVKNNSVESLWYFEGWIRDWFWFLTWRDWHSATHDWGDNLYFLSVLQPNPCRTISCNHPVPAGALLHYFKSHCLNTGQTPTKAYSERFVGISEICVKLLAMNQNQNKHWDSKMFLRSPGRQSLQSSLDSPQSSPREGRWVGNKNRLRMMILFSQWCHLFSRWRLTPSCVWILFVQ